MVPDAAATKSPRPRRWSSSNRSRSSSNSRSSANALKNAQAYTPGVASSSGGCDRGVENAATERGGQQFSSGAFHKALDYYNDALTACPSSDQAQVNVARTYEALGNKPAAIKHYRIAAESNSATVSNASDEAKAALVRLQASLMP